jgi:hypothetical protein
LGIWEMECAVLKNECSATKWSARVERAEGIQRAPYHKKNFK